MSEGPDFLTPVPPKRSMSSRAIRRRRAIAERKVDEMREPERIKAQAAQAARFTSGAFALVGGPERRRVRREFGLSGRQWKKWRRWVAKKVGAKEPVGVS